MWYIVPLPPFRYGPQTPKIPREKIPEEILIVPDPAKIVDEVLGPRPNPWSLLRGQ